MLDFREMGGLPAAGGGTVRAGLLFRSGRWSQASQNDVAALARFGLATIVDFRTDIDRRGDGGPNRIPEGPAHLQLAMADTGGHGAEIRAALMSGDQAVESRLAHYAALGIDAEVVRPLLMVGEEYLRLGLAAVDEGWSSRESYLVDAVGLGRDQIERLREDLLW